MALTQEDVLNGERDLQTLGDVLNGGAAPGFVLNRQGAQIKTVERIIYEIQNGLISVPTAPQLVAPSGAVGDGAADDSFAINAAAAMAGVDGEVFLPKGRYRVPTLTNVPVRFSGPGKLLRTANSGLKVENSYVDQGRKTFGKEYLYRVFQRIRNGGTLKCFWYSNSTGADGAHGGGYAGEDAVPALLMMRMLRELGVPNNVLIYSRAIGGTSVQDCDPIPDVTLDGFTDILFMDFGGNDNIDTFYTQYDNKLSAIRASSGFTAWDQLAIVLVMGAPMSNPSNARGPERQERWRKIHEKLGRKHRCFVVDSTSHIWDAELMSSAAGGLGYDEPFPVAAPGEGVHPREIPQVLRIGVVADAIVESSDLTLWNPAEGKTTPLVAPWVPYGDGYLTPAVSFTKGRRCFFNGGAAKSGGLAQWSQVGSVPTGSEPASNVVCLFSLIDGTPVPVQVQADGAIVLMRAIPNSTFLVFSGSYVAKPY